METLRWFEESVPKGKGKNSTQSFDLPASPNYQTAGILLSLKHSSTFPTHHPIQEGCVRQGFPYIADPLNQFQGEKSPKSHFDLFSYNSGIFNNAVQVNNPDRVATAIDYNGLNCFIPHFGADLSNGYYLQSPIPNGAIPKTNYSQINPDDHHTLTISGPSNVVLNKFSFPNASGNFFVNGTYGKTDEAFSSTDDLPIDVEWVDPRLSNKDTSNVTKQIHPEGVMLGNKCHICGKIYARPSTLKTHLRTHTGEKPFKCSICFRSFAQDANLTAHLRIHSGEKPFKCTVCDRRFAQSSSVTTHMRIHSGERPYKCKVCSRGFADSSTLTKHLRTHTGEKPYQCKLCDTRFSQSGNLSRHMRVHK